mmetsp:Transcript_23421/g.17863  ORF Transcript_23421/g.17863 Transcript_23421/m.17863 type:complete len:293 (+) Transcript_23421:2193-3071(+)
MVGSKKSQDVQFYKESGAVADDLDIKAARKKLNDMDELEQEERERHMKKKLNEKFHKFAKLIESQSEKGRHRLEFDIPFSELDFFGCPMKSIVKVRPTKNCLIAISEFPCFVVDISEIEIAYFERVTFGIKNFDIAFVFRDYTTFKRINSVPIEYLDPIKSYLSEIGIIFFEGVLPMNWQNTLAAIRDDFEGFLEGGAWKFLSDNVDSENGEGEEGESEDEDPEFKVDSEEGEEESESDYSDDDDDDYSSSDLDSEEELSESGMSWDEMEKHAEEEDKKAAVRRQARDNPLP